MEKGSNANTWSEEEDAEGKTEQPAREAQPLPLSAGERGMKLRILLSQTDNEAFKVSEKLR